MSDKIGVFICTGHGIGEALDIDALTEVATDEFKVDLCETIESCDADALAALRERVAAEELTKVVVAGPNSRSYNAGDLPDAINVQVVNLLEWVILTHPPNDEDTDMMAQDYLRMGITMAKESKPVELFEGHADLCKSILVVGGGIAGLTAALDVAETGSDVVLVEKASELGGYMAKLHRSVPTRPPYRDLEDPGIAATVAAVTANERITVHLDSTIESIVGGPGLFDVTLSGAGASAGTFRIGAIVQATGFTTVEPTDFAHLGYGENPDVVTNAAFEEMAKQGAFVRPSDSRPVKSVAFVQCGDSRNPEIFSYASSIMSLNALKQALYIREADADARAFVFYEHLRTPGQQEDFLIRAQEDPGIFLTRGSVNGIAGVNGQIVLEVSDSMLGEDLEVEVDLVVLNCGMKPTGADGEALRKLADSKRVVAEGPGNAKYEECMAAVEALATHEGTEILNLDYRQGPDLPALKHGYPDSHFICFPYESRRTGIYAAGTLRSPMDGASAAEDATGAAMKAMQCLEMLSRGETVHPRSGDQSFPVFSLMRCTQCKRCTEECPFGAINEDAKGTPEYQVTRCRRCGICMGACPERIISFPDYSISAVANCIKSVEVPEEWDEKPRVLVLACQNDALPALEAAALHGIQYSAFARVIPVRCLGAINVVFIKEAISNGFDGVLLFGCKHGDDYQCHMVTGSELMETRGGNIKEALEQMALENERVQLHSIEISDYETIPAVIDEFMELIEEIGMNPFKGM
ncbi:MAG: FAD-dependent oxidoreductase [Deltaproteobacteria bacterium]|nr:FAD-dependent oxidoreductase [Deltaproteobacteria bacterium]